MNRIRRTAPPVTARAAAAPARASTLRWLVFAVAAVVLVQLVCPIRALAAWPVAAGADVSLAFGASYEAEGGSSTHRGVDIPAAAGSEVRAPLDGTVSFAGRVPGPGGGSVLAVTIQTARGALTLMPLAAAGVKKGATVAEGESVGELAAEGDPSSPGSHVHVGARRADLYVDPLGWFQRTAAPAEQPAGEVPASSPAHQAAAAGAAAGARAGSAHVGNASAAGAPAPVPAPAPAAPGARLAPGVTIGGAVAAPLPSVGPRVAASPASLPAPAAGAMRATAVPDSGLAPLIERAMGFAARAARVWALGFVGVLLALGALWPLWRRRGEEGPVEVAVRPLGDDVAAVAGR
jgi:murein DD-endopeptidase MepM/ murein hydrolase activator NlpD